MQDKSKSRNNSKDNLYTNNEVNLEADDFVAGLHMETNRIISGYHNLKPDKKIFILNHTCMSVWQVQVHQTTLWSCTSQQHVPEENQ